MSCKKGETKVSENNDGKLFEYRGVIVGSSGYYKVEVDADGGYAEVVFDGQAHRLTTYKHIEKDKDIDSLVMKDDIVTVVYSFRYADALASISISIAGHDVKYTSSTLYDYRHPQLYTLTNGIRLYEGTTKSTMDGGHFYEGTLNIGLDAFNHTFKGIGKCTNSSDPSQKGETNEVEGTFSETQFTLTMYLNGGDTTIYEKNGNFLKNELTTSTAHFLTEFKYVSF
ncbi:MAG: hypothetical protein WC716_04425 [Chitinophagaceae bacterium]